MIVYLIIILAFILLQFMKESYPRLHSVIYTIYIFLFLYYIIVSILIPYFQEVITIVPAPLLPVVKLLLFSVILLFVSQIVEELLLEYEYTSLASMMSFTTKAMIILVWVNHMKQFYEKFFSIMGLFT
jgi:xanthine/uracil permease